MWADVLANDVAPFKFYAYRFRTLVSPTQAPSEKSGVGGEVVGILIGITVGLCFLARVLKGWDHPKITDHIIFNYPIENPAPSLRNVFPRETKGGRIGGHRGGRQRPGLNHR